MERWWQADWQQTNGLNGSIPGLFGSLDISSNIERFVDMLEKGYNGYMIRHDQAYVDNLSCVVFDTFRLPLWFWWNLWAIKLCGADFVGIDGRSSGLSFVPGRLATLCPVLCK
ncbi:hypothetical protein J5N97_009353 [Dioscorea zingiberensis]|uniref:Uncharacterized protein n=1 Tax=Dioscorea zingiberensis TaxID=325984 RepID=A0A9D5CZ83_9LILI|nr:hypothetical protein J5N97_009353 [Dioscorea zingiberensis]